MGCGSSGSSNNTVTQKTQLPSWLSSALQGMVGQAQSAAAQPYVPYGGPRIAGFTPDQQTGFSQARGAAQSFQPWLTQAAGYTQGAAGGFDQAAFQRYGSPYQQDVIDSTMSELQRQNTIQNAQLDSKATLAGAFGGDRAAVEKTEMNRNFGQLASQTLAGLNNQNWQQAQGQFNADQARQLAAGAQLGQQAGMQQQYGLTGANAMLGIGGQQQNLNQQNMSLAYQDFLTQRGYPMAQAQQLAGILYGYPTSSQSTTSTSQPGASVLGQVGGLGISALGLIGGTGGFGANGWLTGLFGARDGGMVPGFARGGMAGPRGFGYGGGGFGGGNWLGQGQLLGHGFASGGRVSRADNMDAPFLGYDQPGIGGGFDWNYQSDPGGAAYGFEPIPLGEGEIYFPDKGWTVRYDAPETSMPDRRSTRGRRTGFADGGGAGFTPMGYDYGGLSFQVLSSLAAAGDQQAVQELRNRGITLAQPSALPATGRPTALMTTPSGYGARQEPIVGFNSDIPPGGMGAPPPAGAGSVPMPDVPLPAMGAPPPSGPGGGPMPPVDFSLPRRGAGEALGEVGPSSAPGNTFLDRFNAGFDQPQSVISPARPVAGFDLTPSGPDLDQLPRGEMGAPPPSGRYSVPMPDQPLPAMGAPPPSGFAMPEAPRQPYFTGRAPPRPAGAPRPAPAGTGFVPAMPHAMGDTLGFDAGSSGSSGEPPPGRGGLDDTMSPGPGLTRDLQPYGQDDLHSPPAPDPESAAQKAVKTIAGNPDGEDIPSWALPVAMAGFAMMASKSPHALQALGEGGTEGVKAYFLQRRQDAIMAQQQRQQDIENRRNDILDRRTDAYEASVNGKNAGKFSFQPGTGTGPDGKPVAGAYRMNNATGETTFIPGMALTGRGAGGKPSVFQQKLDFARDNLHLDDAAAFKLANGQGTRQADLAKWSLTAAEQEAAADPTLSADERKAYVTRRRDELLGEFQAIDGTGQPSGGGAGAPQLAPQDPSQRKVGQVYRNPQGRYGRWTGQGWEVVTVQ